MSIGFQKLQGQGTTVYEQLQKTGELIEEIQRLNYPDIYKMARMFVGEGYELIPIKKIWEFSQTNTLVSQNFDGRYFGYWTLSLNQRGRGGANNTYGRSRLAIFDNGVRQFQTARTVHGDDIFAFTNAVDQNIIGFGDSALIEGYGAYSDVEGVISFIGFKIGDAVPVSSVLLSLLVQENGLTSFEYRIGNSGPWTILTAENSPVSLITGDDIIQLQNARDSTDNLVNMQFCVSTNGGAQNCQTGLNAGISLSDFSSKEIVVSKLLVNGILMYSDNSNSDLLVLDGFPGSFETIQSPYNFDGSIIFKSPFYDLDIFDFFLLNNYRQVVENAYSVLVAGDFALSGSVGEIILQRTVVTSDFVDYTDPGEPSVFTVNEGDYIGDWTAFDYGNLDYSGGISGSSFKRLGLVTCDDHVFIVLLFGSAYDSSNLSMTFLKYDSELDDNIEVVLPIEKFERFNDLSLFNNLDYEFVPVMAVFVKIPLSDFINVGQDKITIYF